MVGAGPEQDTTSNLIAKQPQHITESALGCHEAGC